LSQAQAPASLETIISHFVESAEKQLNKVGLFDPCRPLLACAFDAGSLWRADAGSL
jgi:hypothetical protein